MLILISHRGEPRTHKATKIESFVSTIKDSVPLAVITKNFVLDFTRELGPLDRFKSDFKQT